MTPGEKEAAIAVMLKIEARHSAWCCWHVVFDDNNYNSVDFCIREAECDDCKELAAILNGKTRGEARALHAQYERRKKRELK